MEQRLRRRVRTVRDALIDTNARYRFLAYGTDWLAFAHLVIAVFFLGPLVDPPRNIWVIVAGLIACVGIVLLAMIAGAIRGIPFRTLLRDPAGAGMALDPTAREDHAV